jgi:hypothetical protein
MADELTISSEYVGRLLLKVRSLMAREETVIPDAAGNATDDERPAVLQETEDDMSREELIEEIAELDEDRQAELVALMWLGRGDAEAEEWESLVETARERRETPTHDYLLDHPLLAEYWASGLEALGYGSVVSYYESR